MGLGISVKLLKPALLAGTVLLLAWPGAPLRAQTQAPTPPPGDARKIQKNIQTNKKSLNEIEKKLAKAKRQQALDARREQNVLNRLQQADQTLNRLKRERQANQQDLTQTQAQTRVLHVEVDLSRSQLD